MELIHEVLKNLRKQSFWLKDRLSGGIIKKELKDVSYIMDNFPASGVRACLNTKLESILEHARTTTPYYTDCSHLNYLSDFPVVNKAIIKEHFEEFVSQKYRQETLSPVVTSGSTGTPFRVLHDPIKKMRNTADTIYFADFAGYGIGSELYYLKVWNKYNKKSFIKAWLENIVPVDVTSLSDENMRILIRKIASRKSKKAILGYASALEEIAGFLMKNPGEKKKFRIDAVITMSEALSDTAKEIISEQLESSVVARYSNVENGIIAQQSRDGGSDYHVNIASYVVEILKMHSDDPALPGEPGRIVITDFYNYGMPMIRYDTGDVGVYHEKSKYDSHIAVLNNIEGRRMDSIFDTEGELLSSFIITNSMWNYPELKQYQFIQLKEKEYCFKLNIDHPFGREKELIGEFKKYLGQDARISVEYVDEIPLLSSGKRKKVMNVMRNGSKYNSSH